MISNAVRTVELTTTHDSRLNIYIYYLYFNDIYSQDEQGHCDECDLNYCKKRKSSPDYGRAVNRPGRSRGGAPSSSLGLANLFPSFETPLPIRPELLQTLAE